MDVDETVVEEVSSPPRTSLAARIVRAKRFLAIFFAVLAAVVVYQAPALLENVQDQVAYDVLEGTPTATAQREFDRYFPDLVGAQTESLLITCTKCNSLVHDEVGEVVRQMVVAINATVTQWNASKGWVAEVRCYYDYTGVVEPLPNPFLSDDQRTMLYQWHWTVPPDGNEQAGALAADALRAGAQALTDQGAAATTFGLSVNGGGPFATHRDVQRANMMDCGVHSVAFLPVGLAILGVRVGSCTMMILPIIVAGGAALTSFAVVSVIANSVAVSAYAPALIMFFSIALSVDYCLILLSRYQEERRAGASLRPALEAMLQNAGAVVLEAGFLLSASTLSVAFLPGGFVGMALAISVAPLSCMLWSLLLLPTLLGFCPGFFDDCVSRRSQSQGRLKGIKRVQSCVASYDLMTRHLVRSPWYWWSSRITVWPCNLFIVIAVLVVSAPLTWAFVGLYKPSIDMTMGEPRGAPSTAVNQMIRQEFQAGVGNPNPIFVLVKPRPSPVCPATVKSNAYFRSSCALAQRIITGTAGTPYEVRSDSIIGVTFHPKTTTRSSTVVDCLPWEDDLMDASPDAKSMLTGNGMFTGLTIKLRGVYTRLWAAAVSRDESAAVTYIAPRIDASTEEGYKLIERIRLLIQDLQMPPTDANGNPMCQLDAYLLSTPSAVNDFVTVTIGKLYGAFGIAVVVCFVLVGYMFGALFLPFKLFFTVGMPIMWSYGVAVLIYQYGYAESLGIESLAQSAGLMWSVPVFTCTLLFGLGLDYDILLFSRIWELRCEGYGNIDAIRLGMASSGGIITSAGLIFVMEMSGGLLSSVPAVDQLSAVIVVAVLIDISVVETCFVPALLSLGTDWNWWPVRMPEVEKAVGEFRRPASAEELLGTVELGGSMAAEKEDADTVPMLRDYSRGADSSRSRDTLNEAALGAGALSTSAAATSASSAFAAARAGREEAVRLEFGKGEHVQVWSHSKSRWMDGKVLAAFDRPCFAEGYAVKAGTFKVDTGRGTKWIAPEQVAVQLRKPQVDV